MLQVSRFVAPRGVTFGDGYAPEPEEHAGLGIVPLTDVHNRQATLILGEPGAGKSTALLQLEGTLSISVPTLFVRRLDLRDCYSERTLESAFDELEMEPAAQTDRLLLLDSVDETPGIISDFVRFLRRRLKVLRASRWRVVAMCRTAETVSALDELFEELEMNAVHVLLPLRSADVTSIAKEHGVNPTEFLQQVRERSLDSLAAIPFTLNLLLQVFAADQSFSASRGEIYDRAISLILAQGGGPQYQPIPHEPLPPLKQRAAAERLAAFVALTNSLGIGTFRPGQVVSGLQTEYLVGQEMVSGSPVELSHADLQSLLKTPLFSDSGANERQFAHRSLRDYLAARCLLRWNLEESQLRSFLTTSNGLSSVPPQMLDIATWLVALAPADFRWLLTADPFNLTKNRITLDRPELAPSLVPLLFDRAAEIDRILAWHDKFEGLRHPKLADQLREQLGTSEANCVLALSILKDSYVEGLEDDLRNLANDVTLGIRSRKLAIEILKEHSLSAQLSGLLPHEPGWFDNDENEELRGALLDAVWPLQLDTPEVLALLVPPPATFYGAYQHFLYSFEKRITAADAASIIRWRAAGLASLDGEHGTTRGESGYSVRQIVARACAVWMASPEAEDDTFNSLILVLDKILKKRRDKLPFARSEVNHEKWRRFIDKLVKNLSAQPHAFHALMILTDAEDRRLFSTEDLPWLGEQAISAGASAIWSELANVLRESDEPRPEIEPRFDRMESGAEEVLRQLTAPEPLSEPAAKRMSQSEYAGAIARLVLATRDRPTEFWRLARWLDVDLEARSYKNSLSPDLLELSGHQFLDGQTIEEILHLALEYLRHAEALPKDLEPSTLDHELIAAYQALHTLEKHRAQLLDDAIDLPWAALSLAVLEFPLPYFPDQNAGDVRRRVLRRVQKAAPDGLEKALIEFLDRLSGDKQRTSSISDLGFICTAAVAKHIPTALLTDNLENFGDLLRLYFDADPESAANWAVEATRSSDDPSRIAVSLAALLDDAPDSGFPALLQFAEERPFLALEVLPEFAALEPRGRVRGVTEDDDLRVRIFEKLCALFPPAEDPTKTAVVHFVTPREEIAKWRDRLLSSVIHAGTRGGLEAITALAKRNPSLELEWAVAAARESYRINGWLPLTIQELRTLLEREGARLVRSNDTLIEAVRQELGCIQGWLGGETPQAFSLWNIAPPEHFVPKDENTISDWYCHALRIRLADSGLIVNREVEVRNNIGPGVGSRQDIRVEIRDPETGELYVTVVEVKGIWHEQVRTSLISQLAEDYLVGGGLTHGIYLVVSFSPRFVSNDRKRKASSKNLEGLEVLLQEQADSLAPELRVIPVIHDGDPPWPPGQRTF